ncbi:MAG: pentapeptide repeat-containing protein, partial [Nitrospirae bacterium]|nr:pentapeptide repeat-containing protein [Nitrospirota bacterium]
ADLKGANFQGADLKGANFRGADLSFTNFQGAVLMYADLSLAYFTDTHLRCANLDGAKIEGYFSNDADKTVDTKVQADWVQIIAQFKENKLFTKRIESTISYCEKWPDSSEKAVKAIFLGKSKGTHVNFMQEFVCKNKYAAEDIINKFNRDRTNASLVDLMKTTCPEFYDEVSKEISGEKVPQPGK